jgi:predicted amidohydrolase
MLEAARRDGADLIVLPEMFACGFSMNTEVIAERADGPTLTFLRERARELGCWLAGSIPIRTRAEQSRPTNSLFFCGPDGQEHRYDKVHPFTYAGEHERYEAGSTRVTFEIEGVRITPFVCYDLRFADEFWDRAQDTDCYVVVANWPQKRVHHWSALLRARAIENLAWVVGVNRVGEGGGLTYSGESAIIDPTGEVLACNGGDETTLLAEVTRARVEETRARFPFLNDR